MNNKIQHLLGALSALLVVTAFPALAQDNPPPGPPPGGGVMQMKSPPPMPREWSIGDEVQAGTLAPDGIGAAVSRGPTTGVYNTDTMTYVPWEDASVIKPLPVGSELPEGLVAFTADGTAFDLNAAVARQPTVLMYYRGGWCPFCNAHLHQLQGTVGKLRDMGYQLLAVSTDTVAMLQEYEESSDLDCLLLSDPALDVATEFGIKFKVVQAYIDHVAEIHVDLDEQNGGYLVTPAAFVLDTKGTVRFVYANNNYTVRVSEKALLDAAQAALAED